jgi:hypothetical protein
VNHGRAAVTDIGALDRVAKLALGESGLRLAQQRGQAGVGQRSADSQPVDLFLGLDRAQPDVLSVEADELEMLLEAAPLGNDERSMTPIRFAPRRFSSRSSWLRPDARSQCTSASRAIFLPSGKVVVPFHEHRHLHAGLEDPVRP